VLYGSTGECHELECLSGTALLRCGYIAGSSLLCWSHTTVVHGLLNWCRASPVPASAPLARHLTCWARLTGTPASNGAAAAAAAAAVPVAAVSAVAER
jgi:hypothetical protein